MNHGAALFSALVLGSACSGDAGGGADSTTAPPTSESAADDTGAADEITTSDDAVDERGSTSVDETTTRAGDLDSTTAAGDESTGAGAVDGHCDWACDVTADCVPFGADPTAYACTDGFCKFLVSPCELCGGEFGDCVQVDGADACVIPCASSDECAAYEMECTGIDDAGNAFCGPPSCATVFAEGEPCTTPGYGQNGVCRNGVCSCTNDTECTVEGSACNLG